MKEKTAAPALPEKKTTEKERQGPDEIWENCRGQCGTDIWCRECMLEKDRLHEEWLNRARQTDDKEE
jgi:hypothetical protein